MNDIAIITILFDYPSNFVPTFEKKLLEVFDKKNYFVIRYFSENENIKNESYYFKFTHFRIRNFIKFVEENILNKFNYFVLLDATDVAFLGNFESIPLIMNEYKCDILFGAERNLWPPTEYSYLHDDKKIDSNYRFLNAGAFCAKPELFIKHSNNIIKRGLFGLCDQGNWQIEYLLNDNIEIDFNNKLVLNTYLAKDDLIIKNNIVEFKTNVPIFIHDNGGYNDETIKLLEFFI